ncbi:MAG: hypothetical protein AB7P03_29565, partial [Kofleriaceae bacterium]
PLLKPLAELVGEWATHGSHPMLPGRTLHGRTTFEWLESGAFLLARMHIDAPEFPDGIAIFGTDDTKPNAGRMMYFDVRNVSREYEWILSGNIWIWMRNHPTFSQRMHLTIADDRQSIVSRGEMSRDGAAWGQDLQLTYTRTR